MRLDERIELCIGLDQLDLLPKLNLGRHSLLLGIGNFFTSGDLALMTCDPILPLLGLRLDDVLEIHEAQQELLQSMSFIFEFIELIESFLIWLWILDQLFSWYLFPELDPLLLLFLLLFLLLC